MKKIMLVGKQSAGKTTLCQYILGEHLNYKKTQAIEILGDGMIDTPGEYLEQRTLYRALMVTSVEADIILFVIDAREINSMFAPAFSTMFTKPCIGIVTKCDIASDEQIDYVVNLLKMAGIDKIFLTSSVTGQGFNELVSYLET